MESEFLAWFIAQHGPRESGLMTGRSDEQLASIVDAAKLAADDLARRKEWDARQQSALYAWQAREKTA